MIETSSRNLGRESWQYNVTDKTPKRANFEKRGMVIRDMLMQSTDLKMNEPQSNSLREPAHKTHSPDSGLSPASGLSLREYVEDSDENVAFGG